MEALKANFTSSSSYAEIHSEKTILEAKAHQDESRLLEWEIGKEFQIQICVNEICENVEQSLCGFRIRAKGILNSSYQPNIIHRKWTLWQSSILDHHVQTVHLRVSNKILDIHCIHNDELYSLESGKIQIEIYSLQNLDTLKRIELPYYFNILNPVSFIETTRNKWYHGLE